MHEPDNTLESFEEAMARRHQGRYTLRLYVTGATPRSARAIANARHICDTYLPGRYDLEVIDVYQYPPRVSDEPILAAPTLMKLSPPPVKRLIGDLSDLERVLRGLGLTAPGEVSS